jgi:ribosomal-protein-alanine N-acetyltransferase
MNPSYFEVFPILQTERLILGPLSREHWNEFKEIVSFNVNPRNSSDPEEVFAKSVLTYNNRESINWAMFLEGELIGFCGFFRGFADDIGEIGYVLRKNFLGMGLMIEAAQVVMDYGLKEMKLKGFKAFTEVSSSPSVKLLVELGFEQTEEFWEEYTKFEFVP